MSAIGASAERSLSMVSRDGVGSPPAPRTPLTPPPGGRAPQPLCPSAPQPLFAPSPPGRPFEGRSVRASGTPDRGRVARTGAFDLQSRSPGRRTMENEKRNRREIANSNERRRMQSINAGFASLRNLLPRHEGEKLSKAAILQQTAEYIYNLEQEKTRLLSQNSQMKRLLSQYEGGEAPPKKRKGEIVIAECGVISEANEDVSSESVAILSLTSASGAGGLSPASELDDARRQLERERRRRITLEEQVQIIGSQVYQPDGIRDISHQITLQYGNTEIVEQSDDLREMVAVSLDDTIDDRISVTDDIHLVPMELPAVVEHHAIAEADPRSRPGSPVDMSVEDERSSSPIRGSLLEAAIKAEPKVEVEVVPGPGSASPGEPSRLFLASTSRQNLETIVEAIRHLEGDHMFAEDQPGREQDRPLALTNKPDQRRLLPDVDYLHFHRPQSRPGVIVGKHS